MERRKYTEYYIALAVSLATFLLYLGSLQNGFVAWDDNLYIYNNPFIRSFDAHLLSTAFSSFHSGNWHPLTWISHALDYAVWGLNPLGHHLTNNILHALNTFIVVLLVMKLLEAANRPQHNAPSAPPLNLRGGRGGLNPTFTLIAAGTTGLLFGLHPLHVESVAWVAERKDLLCAFFYLLSIIMYMKFAMSAPGSRFTIHDSRSARFLFYALCLFILALLSKPMAVSLPAVLLILDWHPLGRVRSLKTFLSALPEKLPFFALAAASSAVTLLAQKAGGALTLTEYVPVSSRLLVAIRSLVSYLGKMVMPLNLIPYYPYPRDVSFLSPDYLFPVAFVTAATVICAAAARKKQKLWLSVWGYYVATLLPVLGIIQVGGQSMADRYTYLPSLGPFLIAGVIAAATYKKLVSLDRLRPFLQFAGGITAAAVLVSLSYLTVQQISIWKNDVALWSHVIVKEQAPITLAYQNRGIAFSDMGRFNEAIADFTEVINWEPMMHPEAYYNRGRAYFLVGRNDAAIEDFSTTILLNPNSIGGYFNRAIAYLKTGQKDLAAADFRKACDMGDSDGCRALRTIESRPAGQ